RVRGRRRRRGGGVFLHSGPPARLSPGARDGRGTDAPGAGQPRVARLRGRRGYGAAPVPPAGTTDRGLRGLRHSSDGSALRGRGGRTAGSRRTVGDRLRRYRGGGGRRAVAGPAAAAGGGGVRDR